MFVSSRGTLANGGSNRHPEPAGGAHHQELLPQQVGQGRVPIVPAGVRVAQPAVRLRRAQAGPGQGGQELWVFDAAADRHLAGRQHGARQEGRGPARIRQPAAATEPAAQQAQAVLEWWVAGEHVEGVWRMMKKALFVYLFIAVCSYVDAVEQNRAVLCDGIVPTTSTSTYAGTHSTLFTYLGSP